MALTFCTSFEKMLKLKVKKFWGSFIRLEKLQGKNLVGRPFWLPTSSIDFKTHARDFESYLKFLRNLENKICMPAETRYFYFSNYLKNDKECGKPLPSPI